MPPKLASDSAPASIGRAATEKLTMPVPDLTRAYVDRLASTFRQVDLPVPAYVNNEILGRLARAIEAANSPEAKLDVMRAVLASIYTNENLAKMLLERYSAVMHVRDFLPQIGDSFKAHFSGLKYASVVTLLTVVEGVVRKMATRASRDVGRGTAKLKIEFQEAVNREITSSNPYGERIAMLEGLRDFVQDNLLKDTDLYTGLDELNRHGIDHGIFSNYGDENNFYRMVTILDLVCISVGLMEGSCSFFALEPTSESRRLAAYYAELQAISATTP
jgi:hypothetical protein